MHGKGRALTPLVLADPNLHQTQSLRIVSVCVDVCRDLQRTGTGQPKLHPDSNH